jgi:hypothetical protein
MRIAMLAAIGLWGMAAGMPAAAATCPRTLRTEQAAIEVPAGAQVEHSGGDWSNLAYVEFYIGDPQPAGPGMAPVRYAEPAAEQSVGPRTVAARWDFSAARAAVWLGCHYHGTRVYLVLPVTASRCAVTWGRGEGGMAIAGAVHAIACE